MDQVTALQILRQVGLVLLQAVQAHQTLLHQVVHPQVALVVPLTVEASLEVAVQAAAGKLGTSFGLGLYTNRPARQKFRPMKNIITFSLIIIGSTVIAQKKVNDQNPPILKPVVLENRQMAIKKDDSYKSKVITEKKVISMYPKFGDYTVEQYYILKSKVPSGRELELIQGSLIKVQENLVSGQEIDPRTLSFTENVHMTRTDFISTVFGREIRAKEPEIPQDFIVHKTNNKDCFGIIQIDAETIAMPYKGVLLILKMI